MAKKWMKILWDPKDDSVSVPPPPSGGGKPQATAVATPARELRPISREADPRTDASLRAAVEEEAKMEGFAEFMELYNSMAGLSGAQRVQVALSSTEAVHKYSAAQVIAATEERLSILDAELEEFTADLEAEGESLVAEKTAKGDELRAAIAEKRDRIKALEEDIARITEQEDDLKDEISGVAREKALRSSQFAKAHGDQSAELRDLLDKLRAAAG